MNRTVLAVGIALLAISAVLYGLVLVGEQPLPGAPLHVSAVGLGVAFLACEAFGVWVERRQGELYGYMLALVPLSVGLVYGDPSQMVLARVVGVTVVLLVTRQRRFCEFFYEVSVHAAQTITAIIVFRLVLGEADPVGVRGAFALLAALFTSYATAAGALAIAVTLVGRKWPGGRAMVVIIRSQALAGVLNAAIGIGLATTLWEHPHVALLLFAVGVACYASNRIYTGLAQRHRRLQTHYEFVSSVGASTDRAEITNSVREPARTLLRADDAVLLLRPVGDDEPARRIGLGLSGPQETDVSR